VVIGQFLAAPGAKPKDTHVATITLTPKPGSGSVSPMTASGTYVDETSLKFTLPEQNALAQNWTGTPLRYDVTVSRGSLMTSPLDFTIDAVPAPVITDVRRGAELAIVIEGKNLGPFPPDPRLIADAEFTPVTVKCTGPNAADVRVRFDPPADSMRITGRFIDAPTPGNYTFTVTRGKAVSNEVVVTVPA
jgi:hypothetical protein